MTLDELERLEKAATPGPWTTKPCSRNDWPFAVDTGNSAYGLVCETEEADAALIAAARNALPELIKIARAVAEDDPFDVVEPCHWCGIGKGEEHAPDCTWVAARKLVGGVP